MKRVVATMCFAMCLAIAADDKPKAAEPAAASTTTPFLLSEMEQVKLENLRLRRQMLESQFMALTQDVQNYVTATQAAHKNTPGVSFDNANMTWKVDSPKPAAKPAEKK